MPRGARPKREQEYRELKKEFKQEGRYKGREEEVAARIVNKQRAQYGETKQERQKDREGRSPDRNLPINNYQHLTADQVVHRADSLSKSQIRTIVQYEKKHKNRKTVLNRLNKAA